MSLAALLDAHKALQEYDRFHRIESYDPYPFQREFHFSKADQVALICANQIGKTTAGAAEVTYHALGEYPDWWEGRRFTKPVTILCAGVSNDSTKRIIQNELVGSPYGTPNWGTGMIPRTRLRTPTRKPGVPEAYETLRVDGKYGESTIWVMAYEQGWQKFQGIRFDYAWPDEEPPSDVWSQLLRGTISRPGSKIAMTMTPEEGMTEVVAGFYNDIKIGQALITATWEDAKHDDENKLHGIGDTHLTEEKKEQILSALPKHQRDMRSKGIPLMGSGLIFPVKEDDLVVDQMQIPDHWAQIIGVDFGIEHPFGAVRICWDRDSDIIYITNEYRETGKTPPTHVSAVRAWGGWQPVMWPHDGIKRDPGSGKRLSEVYRQAGLTKMHYEKFSNPPAQGQKEGEGGQGVEAGLMELLTRMETGRFKVFSNCVKWLEELRMYHRKNGLIIRERDDLMSATRYAAQMLRFARTNQSAYSRDIIYSNKGIV